VERKESTLHAVGIFLFSPKVTKNPERWVELANSRPPEPLAIPPGNSIPTLPRNIEFIVDAVYFHKSNLLYKYSASGVDTYNSFQQNNNQVMQIFYKGEHDGDPVVRGYASNLSHTSSTKYVVLKAYDQYYNVVNGTEPSGTFNHWSFITIAHEIYHLLGLSHTVLFNNGSACPNTSITACNDGCADTPTPYEIINFFGVSPNSACGMVSNSYCSNNYMDYVNGAGLTPCQLEIMHSGLEGGLINYTVCEAISFDNTICEIGFPKIRHFGKNILIQSCFGNTPTLENGEYNKIYISKQIEIENIEIESNAEFEIIFETDC
jgi:hypothetical protein